MNDLCKKQLEELKQLVSDSHNEIDELYKKISNLQFKVFDAVEELQGEIWDSDDADEADKEMADTILEELRADLKGANENFTDAITYKYYELEKTILNLGNTTTDEE